MPKNLTLDEQAEWKRKQVQRVKEWVAENPEKAKKNKRRYYDTNKTDVIAAAKKSRADNPEKAKENVDRYQSKHKVKILEKSREYYKKNREKVLNYHKLYREKNKRLVAERVRMSQRKNPLRLRVAKYVRRSREKTGRISTERVKELFRIQNGKCNYCSADLHVYHIDHIIPLAMGGLNTDFNIQLLCPSCNRRKGAKHPDQLDWIIK